MTRYDLATLAMASLDAVDAELTHRAQKAVEDELPPLVRAAARLEPRLRQAFLRAAASARAAIDVDALAAALLSGRLAPEALDDALRVAAAQLGEEAAGPLRQGFTLGARHAAAQVPGGFAGGLTLVSPEATAWAAQSAATLVVQIDAATRTGLRTLITEALAGERDVWATARLIAEIVGLDARRVQAIDARRARWEADGLTGDRLWARVGRLAASHLKQRGEVIARTEIMTAAAQGQRALWAAAEREGLLVAAETAREWMATDDDRLDETCEELDGTTAPLDGEFPGGYASPPAHPQCRCTTRLVFE